MSPWTSERVCDLLVELCRGRGAFAATPGQMESQLNWRRRFLAHDRDGWTYLTTWACCQASAEAISARMRERGWSRHRFETGWRRAAATIAAGLELEAGHNAAAFDAAEQSEERLVAQGRIPPAAMSQPILLQSA